MKETVYWTYEQVSVFKKQQKRKRNDGINRKYPFCSFSVFTIPLYQYSAEIVDRDGYEQQENIASAKREKIINSNYYGEINK